MKSKQLTLLIWLMMILNYLSYFWPYCWRPDIFRSAFALFVHGALLWILSVLLLVQIIKLKSEFIESVPRTISIILTYFLFLILYFFYTYAHVIFNF